MLIPACRAYRTLYWEWVTTLAGSQTNGYSRAAIPSVAAAVAQPTCTIRQISQAIALMGSRSTRAAISPGMTRVPPPRRRRLPRYLVPLRFSLLPSGSGDGGVKRGIAAPLPPMSMGARVAVDDAGHQRGRRRLWRRRRRRVGVGSCPCRSG